MNSHTLTLPINGGLAENLTGLPGRGGGEMWHTWALNTYRNKYKRTAVGIRVKTTYFWPKKVFFIETKSLCKLCGGGGGGGGVGGGGGGGGGGGRTILDD